MAGLAVWAHVHHGQSLTAGTILEPAVVEAYCTSLTHLTDLSQAARSTTLLSLTGRSAQRTIRPKVDKRLDPYMLAEVAQIRHWAESQPTAALRAKASVLLALTLGAGLRHGEVRDLRVMGIQPCGPDLLVNVPGPTPRPVTVDAAWRAPLLDLVAAVPAYEHAFLPGRPSYVSDRIVGSFLKKTRRIGLVPTASRLRQTWIIRQLPGRTNLEVGAMAGLGTIVNRTPRRGTLADYLEELQP